MWPSAGIGKGKGWACGYPQHGVLIDLPPQRVQELIDHPDVTLVAYRSRNPFCAVSRRCTSAMPVSMKRRTGTSRGRPGQHEALISYETFQRIQDRLAGVNRLPKRQNLNADFPLRGFVLCADCETPLTACWSTGNTARHPYYLCPKPGCVGCGKSTRRDKIEGEFETLLLSVRPTEGLFTVARAMFQELWTHRLEQAASQKKALEAQLAKIDGQVCQLLTRILDTSVPSVICAYEEKVRTLQSDKLLIKERLASAGRPASSFDNALRTALTFLTNPCKLWSSERLEDRRTVLKLTLRRTPALQAKRGV